MKHQPGRRRKGRERTARERRKRTKKGLLPSLGPLKLILYQGFPQGHDIGMSVFVKFLRKQKMACNVFGIVNTDTDLGH